MKSMVALLAAASILTPAGPVLAAGPDALPGSYAAAAAGLRRPASAPGAIGIKVAYSETSDKSIGRKKQPPAGLSSVDELRWWDSNYSSVTTFFYSWFWVPNMVSNADIDAAAATYNRLLAAGGSAGPEQKVQFLIRGVRDRFQGADRVCRHHAALFYYTARRVGLNDVELRQFVSNPNFRDDGGHCWNRITIDGQRFVVSSDWETYYRD